MSEQTPTEPSKRARVNAYLILLGYKPVREDGAKEQKTGGNQCGGTSKRDVSYE
jgi:hypothetical protein